MKIETGKLAPGLYFVSTPIGAARDITLRALDTLASADVLVAEDTRTLRHLMRMHGVAVAGRRVFSYHEHSAAGARDGIVKLIAEGLSVAYASEAGTPLVADPGFQLSRAVIDAGFTVTGVPGPSAAIAALTVSGLPSDRFFFAGFSPSGKAARRRWIAEFTGVQATLIIYESPRRLAAFLEDVAEQMGPDRAVVVCRELTKKFEEVLRGTALELAQMLAERDVKGEIVVLIDRAPPQSADAPSLEAALRQALATQSVKDAAKDVAAALGLPRREVYQAALAIASRQKNPE